MTTIWNNIHVEFSKILVIIIIHLHGVRLEVSKLLFIYMDVHCRSREYIRYKGTKQNLKYTALFQIIFSIIIIIIIMI